MLAGEKFLWSLIRLLKKKNVMFCFQEKVCIKELQKELLSKCKSHQTKAKYEQLEDILQNKNVGYLLNERFINIPSQLAVPFHQSL